MFSTIAKSDLHGYLKENSTDRYYIDYYGTLTNHISQGIIALSLLGATKTQIHVFIDTYSQKLISQDKVKEDILCPKDEEMGRLKGKRLGFYHLRKFYEKRVTGDLTSAIATYFPVLCRGMMGSAVHGLIYLGYGFAAKSSVTVAEGLAYLHFASMPLETDQNLRGKTPGNGDEYIIDVLKKVRSTKLHDFMMRKIEEAPWDTFDIWDTTKFQQKAGVLFSCKADQILSYVYQIKFPEQLQDKELSVHEEAAKLGIWLVDIALQVYVAAAKTNDFFLLHGVTSAWAMKQLLPCLKSKEDINEAVAIYLSTLLAVYIVQGRPSLDLSKLRDTKAESRSWDDIIAATLEPPKEDEHIYKMVQICYDMAQESSDIQDINLYKVAACIVKKNEFVF